MSKLVRPLSFFKLIAAASVFVLAAQGVYAQNLGVSGNQITISAPGFNQNATLSAGGTVTPVTGVPTSGTLTTPTFTFTLEHDTAVNESGTYAVGIVIDEDTSMRRLEVFIPGVVLNFTVGVLAGTLTTPSVNIYGRDTSGATTDFSSQWRLGEFQWLLSKL